MRHTNSALNIQSSNLTYKEYQKDQLNQQFKSSTRTTKDTITNIKKVKESNRSQDDNQINICLYFKNEKINNNDHDKKSLMSYEEQLQEKEKRITSLQKELKTKRHLIQKLKHDINFNQIMNYHNRNSLHSVSSQKDKSKRSNSKSSSIVSKTVRHFFQHILSKSSKNIKTTINKQSNLQSPKLKNYLNSETFLTYSPKSFVYEKSSVKHKTIYENKEQSPLIQKWHDHRKQFSNNSTKVSIAANEMESELNKIRERTQSLLNFSMKIWNEKSGYYNIN